MSRFRIPDPEELEAYREQKGISRSEAADALGLSYQTVWRWEQGKCDPNRSELIRLLNYYRSP